MNTNAGKSIYLPKRLRKLIKGVALDMAASMNSTIQRCFRNAHHVIERFHVQKPAFETEKEIRIHIAGGIRGEKYSHEPGQMTRGHKVIFCM